MRIAELSRSIPLPRHRIPRHREIPLVPAEHDVREPHDDVRGGESEQHEEDVKVDKVDPVPGGFPDAAEGKGAEIVLVGCGAVGGG